MLDRSGVPGKFTFHANLFNLEKGASAGDIKRSMMDGDAAGTLKITLQEQLGLRLEAQKAPIEVLVVDRADRVPAAN